ncbi:putative glycolipid-binding domain-containing protein [Pseudovibrio sp. SPO723]|uniref:putative glycolipid-binding domain-containing protein n=1 Tax=Nesiotobacter zosterae TaxID=392721 RepID=UPI0029C493C1|nr:putative glycolipid-binding domain-containing protein [Pseudovibrio sp. SPO723]MDX5595741.1 putative glycolipid-binding domain-containing protein [Pseudovibrio sp. SPO723]
MHLNRTIRWSDWNNTGLEHFTLRQVGTLYAVSSVVIGNREDASYGLHYTMELDLNWRTRRFSVTLTDGTSRTLVSDGNGNWQDGTGKELKHLSGCLDVDFAATPFTNTLPIRRLKLAINTAADLNVAYIPVPSLLPETVDQRYTRRTESSYLYEGLFRKFTATLEVDEDGFVFDYPETFRRVMG